MAMTFSSSSSFSAGEESVDTGSIILMADDAVSLTQRNGVPLDSQLAQPTDNNLQDTEALPHKQPASFTTSLPYILKFDDDFVGSCLNLVYGGNALDPSSETITVTPIEKNTDDQPSLSTEIVTSTCLIQDMDELELPTGDDDTTTSDNVDATQSHQPQNELITPPIDDDIGKKEDYALFSPPPSAKSLTTEFHSFSNAITPASDITSTKYDTISIHESILQDSSHQSLYSRASVSTGSLTIHNNHSQLDFDQDHLQQQPLPPLPQHPKEEYHQRSQEKHELDCYVQSPASSPSLDSLPCDLPPKDLIPQIYHDTKPYMINDGDYYPDSSLYAASITDPAPNPVSLKSYHPPFPDISLAHLHLFRQDAQTNPDDLELQLNFAKYLMEAVEHVWIDDPARSLKAKTAMLSEAQRIVKTLAIKSSKIGRLGYADAQFYLANAYGSGLMLLRQSPEKAFNLYLQGSKQCHTECTYRVGVCYELGLGTRKDHARAIRFYRKAAQLGDPSAMYKLAIVLLNGLLGQGKQPKEAISWLKRAVPLTDAYHPEILHELGVAYEADSAIPSVIPDPDYAAELFTKAARFGYAPSQYKIGLAYEHGLWNHPVDPKRSIAWYSKSAEQGYWESALAISGWYLTGASDGLSILPQDDREAYLWARKAADAGYAKGQYACGYYCETGIGVPQNWDDAQRWYEQAAKQRYSKAVSRLAEMKHTLHRRTLSSPSQQQLSSSRGRSANTKPSVEQKRSSCQIM